MKDLKDMYLAVQDERTNVQGLEPIIPFERRATERSTQLKTVRETQLDFAFEVLRMRKRYLESKDQIF